VRSGIVECGGDCVQSDEIMPKHRSLSKGFRQATKFAQNLVKPKVPSTLSMIRQNPDIDSSEYEGETIGRLSIRTEAEVVLNSRREVCDETWLR
jgi:hypothetical protein